MDKTNQDLKSGMKILIALFFFIMAILILVLGDGLIGSLTTKLLVKE